MKDLADTLLSLHGGIKEGRVIRSRLKYHETLLHVFNELSVCALKWYDGIAAAAFLEPLPPDMAHFIDGDGMQDFLKWVESLCAPVFSQSVPTHKDTTIALDQIIQCVAVIIQFPDPTGRLRTLDEADITAFAQKLVALQSMDSALIKCCKQLKETVGTDVRILATRHTI